MIRQIIACGRRRPAARSSWRPSPAACTGPRHRRAAGDRRQAASARAVDVAAALGRREPALLQLVRPAGPEGPQRLPDLRPPYGRAAPLTRPSPCARLDRTSLLHRRLAGRWRRRLRRQRPRLPGGPRAARRGAGPATRPPAARGDATRRRRRRRRRRRPPSRAARPPRTISRARRAPTPSASTDTDGRHRPAAPTRHRQRRRDRPRQDDSAANDAAPPAGLRRRAVRGLLRAEPRRLLSPPARRWAASRIKAHAAAADTRRDPRSQRGCPFPTRSPLRQAPTPARPAPGTVAACLAPRRDAAAAGRAARTSTRR